MKITAQDLLRFGIIDEIIREPLGGAHRAPQDAIHAAGDAIASALAEFEGMSRDEVLQHRRAKFLAIGKTL